MKDLSNEWIPVAIINDRCVAKYPDETFKSSRDGKIWENASEDEITEFNRIEKRNKNGY